MKTSFLTIPGSKGGIIWDNHDGSFTWTGIGEDDTDGCGSLHGDPDGQRDTSLHKNGKPLNADIDRYVVVTRLFFPLVGAKVLGCKAVVLNHSNGKMSNGVVGDVGPAKLGEYSNAMNEALGLSGSPLYGGTEDHIIQCTIWPGRPADGYSLQAWK